MDQLKVLYVKTIEELRSSLEILKTSYMVSLDLETTGLDVFTDKILLIGLKVNDQYIIYNYDLLRSDLKEVFKILTNRLILGHNLKFDLKFIYHNFDILLTDVYDTFIAEGVLYAGIGNLYNSLEALCDKYFNISLNKATRKEFIDKEDNTFTDEQLEYLCDDVKYLEDIYELQQKTSKELNLQKIIALEMRVIPVVTMMEYTGISIDKKSWTKLIEEYTIKANKLEQELRNSILDELMQFLQDKNLLEIANELSIPVKRKSDKIILESIVDLKYCKDWLFEHININSPKQMVTILRKIGVDVPNTNESTLKEYPNNLIIKKLLEFRETEKLITTYGNNILDKINPVTHKLHPEFNQIGTVTGRFSSSNPNGQNIPANAEFRKNFIASPGFKLITADYNQQEYRLAGAISKDPVIIDAYKQGHDMHTSTGAIAYEIPLANVSKEQRYDGKRINFLTLYGGSAKKLHKILGFSLQKSKKIISSINDAYSVLTVFREKYGEAVFDKGYSVTVFGRKRFYAKKNLYTSIEEFQQIKGEIMRQGYNALIQGTGADIVKLALIKCFYENPFGIDNFKLLLQVHDEIVFEVREDIVKEAVDFIKKSLEEVEQQFLGEIPAVAEVTINDYWAK